VQAEGGDADYDGGCARAISYSAAYSKACAEAIAISFVDYTYGKKTKCHCDVSVQTIQTAIAHEVEIIFAFYETQIEARSCNMDNVGTPDISYIAQSCIATSAADLLVKAMASVVLEGKCVPGGDDKVEYCEGECKEYETYDEDWTACVAECTKSSSVKVTAAVKAVANIEIKSEEYCNGYDYLRTGETYLVKLNGGTTPGTSTP